MAVTKTLTFAYGNTAEGQEIHRMIIDGCARHGWEHLGRYVKHCIRETSKREQVPHEKKVIKQKIAA